MQIWEWEDEGQNRESVWLIRCGMNPLVFSSSPDYPASLPLIPENLFPPHPPAGLPLATGLELLVPRPFFPRMREGL